MARKTEKKSIKKLKKEAVVSRRADTGKMSPETVKLLMTALAAAAAVVIMAMAAVVLKPKEDTLPVPAVSQEAAADEAQALMQTPEAARPDFERLFKEAALKQEINKIDIEEAKYLFDSGRAVFVDARSRSEYDRQHIKGAISLETGASNEEIIKAAKKYRNKVLVTYCHGSGCHLADKVAYRLFDAGHKKLAIFWGGWPKWDEHKYPESTGR